MKNVSTVVLVVVATALVAFSGMCNAQPTQQPHHFTVDDYHTYFNGFMNHFNKTYDVSDLDMRFNIFQMKPAKDTFLMR